MTTIKIDGTPHQVPTSWDEITFDHFLYSQYEARDFIDTVAYITGIPRQTFLDAERSLFATVAQTMAFMKAPILERKPTDNFTFRGVRYLYDNQYAQITLGQAVDLDERLREFAGDQVYRAYPYITAILYRPEGEKVYDSKAAAERAEQLRHLPVPVCMAVVGFFLSRKQSLERRILLSQNLRQIAQIIGLPSNSSVSTG